MLPLSLSAIPVLCATPPALHRLEQLTCTCFTLSCCVSCITCSALQSLTTCPAPAPPSPAPFPIAVAKGPRKPPECSSGQEVRVRSPLPRRGFRGIGPCRKGEGALMGRERASTKKGGSVPRAAQWKPIARGASGSIGGGSQVMAQWRRMQLQGCGSGGCGCSAASAVAAAAVAASAASCCCFCGQRGGSCDGCSCMASALSERIMSCK